MGVSLEWGGGWSTDEPTVPSPKALGPPWDPGSSGLGWGVYLLAFTELGDLELTIVSDGLAFSAIFSLLRNKKDVLCSCQLKSPTMVTATHT